LRKRRHARLATLLVAMGLLAAACGTDEGAGAEAGGGEGGRFSVYICEPEHLIPQDTNEVCGAEVLNALFTPLVEYDPQTSAQTFQGAMAESITSPDQTVWTIRLKDGWTFHNGEPVTARSFVDAWNAGAYGPNAYGNAYFFENIEGYQDLQADKGNKPRAKAMRGLKVIDDTTFEVTLNGPFSQFPLTLGYTAFYPLPKAFFDDPKAFEEAPVGNGPFQMDGTWQHDRAVNVKRFEHYAGDRARADAIEFRIYSNINTAYNDLLAGNLDIMDNLPPERLGDARQRFGDRFIERDSSAFTYIGFPLYDQRFADPDLRRAFSMAIDRQAIIDAIFNGAYTPARSVVSPVVRGARDNPCGEACTYNPQRAKELLRQAGGWDGELVLWFNSGQGHDQWMNAVANQLRQNLGIADIRFESLQFAQYLEKLDDEEVTGPFRLGWVMDYPSPQNYLQPLFSTTGSSNNFGYANQRADELIAQGNGASGVEEGIRLYQQAEDQILRDMPNIPMWFEQVQGAHSDSVGNVVIDAFERIRTADVTVTGT
jgi:oligopeptide transport system substrate-binding protein